MKIVPHNDSEIPILNEVWVVNFYDHKSLSFSSKEDMERYLRGELSEEHGYMEYERIPSGVEHTVYYDINWESD